MKICKKLTALFTALCILSAMFGSVSVAAADEVAPTSISIDFDNFTTNDEASLTNDDWTTVLRRRTNTGDKSGSDLMNYECVKGARGKAADDGALKAYYKSGTLEAGTDVAMFLKFNTKNPIFVENGEYYEVSMDLLWEGPGTTKQVRAGIPGDDGTLSNQITYLIDIGGNGKVTSPALCADNGNKFTKSPDYTTKAGVWYNYRFVVKAGENNPASGLDADKSYHWIYINGVLVSEGTFTHYNRNKDNTDKITRFRGFSYIWYLFNEKTLTSKPSADTEITIDDPSIIYLDNLSISKPEALPEVKNIKTVDFDTHTVSNDISAVKSDLVKNPGYYNDVHYQNLTGDVYNIADGIYGKDTGDHSLFMQKGTDWTHSIDETQFVGFTEVGYNTSGATDTTVSTNPGDFYEMELSMAWDGDGENKAVQTFYNIDQPGDGKATGYTLNVSSTGNVTAMNTSIPEAGILSAKTWYKFNLVIHAGDNTAANDADKNWFKLYINDKLVKDRTVFVPNARTAVTTVGADGSSTTSNKGVNYDKFRGFRKYWLTLQTLKTENPAGVATPGVYFDDFSVKHCGTTEPVYTSVVLDSDNAVVANYIACDSKIGGFNAYIDERGAGAKITSNDGAVQLYDANYNKVDALNGKTNHFKVTRNNGTELYGIVKNENVLVKNETFEALEAGTKANFNYAVKAYTVENYEAGIAGKNADDYALTMRTTDAWQDGNDNLAPFLQVTVGNGAVIPSEIVRDVYTVEYSLRVTGDAYGTNLIFVPADNSNGEGWYRPFTVTDDDRVSVRKDINEPDARYDIAKIRQGEWVRYAITVYPQTNKVETYINDKLIQTQNMWIKGNNYAARFKIEQAFSSTGEGDTKSGEFSIDDFRIYSGSRPAMNPVVLESSDDTMFDIYNDGDIIFMPGEAIYEDIAVNVSGYGTAKVMPTVFADDSMTDVLTSMDDVLEEGNVFMVANDDGLVYEYFYLAEGEATDFKVSGATNSNNTSISWNVVGHKDLRAHFNCYKSFPANATVVFAQYSKGGELLATGFAENEYSVNVLASEYAWPVKASSGAVAIEIEDSQDYVVKLFVLEDFGSIKPLTDVTILK